MTCRQCRNFKDCLLEAENLGQIFDPDYDGEHSCGAKQFSHITNTDRIQAMSDEKKRKTLIIEELVDEFIDWLQQPAKEYEP